MYFRFKFMNQFYQRKNLHLYWEHFEREALFYVHIIVFPFTVFCG